MANIKTAKQLAGEAADRERHDHKRNCPRGTFPKPSSYTDRRWQEGDIGRCKHGMILVYLSEGSYYGVVAVKELSPKRNPILYRRAVALLAKEKAEERDGGD